MSKAADRSSKMSTVDLEAALASLRASVTESRAVLVEWPLLKSTLSTVDKSTCFLKTLVSLQFSDLHFDIIFSEKCNSSSIHL